MADPFDFDEVHDRRCVPALKVHPIVLGDDGVHLFPAGVADMDFRVAPAITQALARRLEHGIFGYEAVPEGLIPALVYWLRTRHNWVADPNHILRAPNVLNSLALATSLFSEEGDGIIVQPPVFFDFFDIIRENSRSIVENPLRLTDGRYEMDFTGLERLAANPRNKLLFLCNPHNPVGRVWEREELERLGDICARHKVLVVSDELHGDITFAGHSYTPFASLGEAFAGNSITFLSPAKSFNIAGVCWSFIVVTDEQRRKSLQAESSRLTVNKNNAFSSVAMEAAYREGGPWLDAAIDYLQGNLDLLRSEIGTTPGVDLVEPEGTFLAWLDFRELFDQPDELHTFLRSKAGWAVTRGAAFGETGAGFARLNFACPRNKLAAALAQLRTALG